MVIFNVETTDAIGNRSTISEIKLAESFCVKAVIARIVDDNFLMWADLYAASVSASMFLTVRKNRGKKRITYSASDFPRYNENKTQYMAQIARQIIDVFIEDRVL